MSLYPDPHQRRALDKTYMPLPGFAPGFTPRKGVVLGFYTTRAYRPKTRNAFKSYCIQERVVNSKREKTKNFK